MRDAWYRTAVIYSLDVETFLDSNGDGVGDLQGLTSKLDYLANLGVTCIWLLPFYPSPNRDNGYDVTDFYGVDPRLGTLGDFVDLTRAAQERGIRLLIDLVINHTSAEHPWFEAARRDPQSRYRDFYIWSDEKPENADEGMVFPGVQESTWTWDDAAGAWYFHRFYAHQPDLNIANPAVRDEIWRVVRYWLQLGVSGFRVDALPFVIEQIDQAEPKRDPDLLLRELRDNLSWHRGDAVLLAEANVPPSDVGRYVTNGDRIHMMLNFYANQHLFLALAAHDAQPIRSAYAELPQLPDTCVWANFLRTHDELDLGRLDTDERARVFDVFAPDPAMRLYDRGIRRRLAPMLQNERRRLELAHSLILTLPGVPVLRYGDEIGMGDDLTLDERNSVRTPMQWSDQANAGFSSAPADALIRPVIDEGPHQYSKVNVAAQQRDANSLLSWTARIIGVRRQCPEFWSGHAEFLDVNQPDVLVHRLRHDSTSVLVVHNLSKEARQLTLPLLDGRQARDLLDPDEAATTSGTPVELPAYGYRWFREETPAP